MKVRDLLAPLLTAALMAGAIPSQAATESATYVTGGRVAIAGGSVGSQGNLGEGLGRGGYSFTPTFVPRKLKIVDDVTLFIGYSICQDGGGGVCGQDVGDTVPDVREAGCVTGTGFITLTNTYRANAQTTVFIDAINGDCPEVAVTGTITLSN